MNSKALHRIGVAALISLWSSHVLAQMTGRIDGRVLNQQGEALSGVTVSVSSPSLLGGSTAVSASGGHFRLLNLPPGDYTLQANLAGYQPLEVNEILVGLGKTVRLELELTARYEERLTVTASSPPAVDHANTTTGANFTENLFTQLPVSRSALSISFLTPGATYGGLGAIPSIRGASAAENRYVIDGLDTTDAKNGVLGVDLVFEFIEEVEVKTGGYQAEYDGATGGIINVITKSGSNEFRGSLFGYYWDTDLQATPRSFEERGQEPEDRQEYDFGFEVGGRIIRDHLWYFASLNPDVVRRDVTTLQGQRVPSKRESPRYAGKLSWQIDPGQRLVGSVFGDPADGSDWVDFSGAGVLASDFESGSNNATLSYSNTLGKNWFLEAFIGSYNEESQGTPVSQESPIYRDSTPGARWARAEGCGDPDVLPFTNVLFAHGCRGGVVVREENDRQRNQLRASATRFFGQHELKGGFDYRDVDHSEIVHYPSATEDALVDALGTVVADGIPGSTIQLFPSFYFLVVDEFSSPSNTEELALFVQDSWQMTPRLTVNLGLRFNSLEATGALTREYPDRKLEWDLGEMIAPRVGLTWDVIGNGRSKLFGSAGRYYESLPLFVNTAFGEWTIDLHFFRYPEDGSLPTYDNLGVHLFSLNLGTEILVDPKTSPVYADEFMLGYQYQLTPNWTLGLTAVYRDLRETVEDLSVDGAETYFITNPGDTYTQNPVTGETLPEPVTFPEPERLYRALELTFNRRYAGNWQLAGSYVYSENRGNHGGLYDQDTGALAPNLTPAFDSPTWGGSGPLPNDRPHDFKIFGTYRLPFRLSMGFEGRYRSGTPINKLGIEPLYFTETRFIGPRGAGGRTPDIWWLDLHLHYPVRLPAGLEFDLVADVFNVADNDRPTVVDQTWTFAVAEETLPGECGGPGSGAGTTCPEGNPEWGRPLGFQGPRAVRLGLKLRW